MSPPSTEPRRLPLGLATVVGIFAGVVWSLGAIHVATARSDAFQYLIWRSVAIVVVVEILARRARRRSPTALAFTGGWLMLLTCVLLLVASLGFVYAVDINGAAQSAFLSSTTPLMAVLLARVALGERPSLVSYAAVVVGLIGLGVMVGGTVGGSSVVGNLAAFSSSLGFAGYTVCVRSDVRRDWSPVMPGYALMMIVLCTAVSIGRGRTPVPGFQPVTLALIHGAVYIVIGTLAFNLAARTVPAVAMTVYAQAEMVFVPVWAALVLHEQPSARAVVGAAIVFAAIVVNAVWGHRQPVKVGPA